MRCEMLVLRYLVLTTVKKIYVEKSCPTQNSIYYKIHDGNTAWVLNYIITELGPKFIKPYIYVYFFYNIRYIIYIYWAIVQYVNTYNCLIRLELSFSNRGPRSFLLYYTPRVANYFIAMWQTITFFLFEHVIKLWKEEGHDVMYCEHSVNIKYILIFRAPWICHRRRVQRRKNVGNADL